MILFLQKLWKNRTLLPYIWSLLPYTPFLHKILFRYVFYINKQCWQKLCTRNRCKPPGPGWFSSFQYTFRKTNGKSLFSSRFLSKFRRFNDRTTANMIYFITFCFVINPHPLPSRMTHWKKAPKLTFSFFASIFTKICTFNDWTTANMLYFITFCPKTTFSRQKCNVFASWSETPPPPPPLHLVIAKRRQN